MFLLLTAATATTVTSTMLWKVFWGQEYLLEGFYNNTSRSPRQAQGDLRVGPHCRLSSSELFSPVTVAVANALYSIQSPAPAAGSPAPNSRERDPDGPNLGHTSTHVPRGCGRGPRARGKSRAAGGRQRFPQKVAPEMGLQDAGRPRRQGSGHSLASPLPRCLTVKNLVFTSEPGG